MPFELGCKFTVENFLIGALGGIVAVLVLPGSYMTLPRMIRLEDGEQRVCWGAFARIIVAGIGGCVVDCNQRNTFFGGFFSWHMFRWAADDGWKMVSGELKRLARQR